jgi:hypothetical protein
VCVCGGLEMDVCVDGSVRDGYDVQVYWSRRHVDLGVRTLQFLEVFLQS